MSTPRDRNLAIDALRGAVMVLMALDHARDFYADGFRTEPTNLATTTAALFATRWITHFCAPVFVFLAGTAAFLYRAKHGPAAGSRFLLTRGLWLVLLELTAMRLGWTPDPFYRFTLLQVIWAIGWSMVALSALSRLPLVAVAGVGAALVAGHNLLDAVTPADLGRLGWLWKIAHEGGALEPLRDHRLYVAYPVLPWIGVIALGYAFGAWMRLPLELRRPRTLRLGLALTAAFVLLRALNRYGDPVPWSSQPRGALFTAMSFLNCDKYPPSLLYALMTLGPALCALALLDGAKPGRAMRVLSVYGSVPLLYYFAHLVLMRWTGLAISFARFGSEVISSRGRTGLGLGAAYLGWIVVVVGLYPLCRWFAGVKARRRDWWLSYL
ncbi:MAG: DUF1624 domain-containing protein [Myxococcaceae bacterium]|nr:MAG: DUF1624 domain-containing protein [Myxococcaceae bacterium]